MLNTVMGRLRLIGFLEGTSFLLLLFVAMPVKYMLHEPILVKYLGMAHGVLFLLYVVMVLFARMEYKWSISKTALALVASVLPFGPFVADKKLFREPETA